MRRALLIVLVLTLVLAAPFSAGATESGIADSGATVVAVFSTDVAAECPAPEAGFSVPPPAYAVVHPPLAHTARLDRPPHA